LGKEGESSKFREAMSPITYVKKTSPPVFIVHGDADPIVPYQQSVDLKKKLDEVGVKNEFITEPGGGHGKFTKEQSSELGKSINAFIKGLNILNQ
jgi:dipeptidyl aminopeptidase/acylaminoacyl peptidase